MKKTKFFILFVCILFLVSCAEQKILERVSLVTLIGYDVGDDKKVATTAVIRQINPELQSKVEIQSDTDNTSKGTRFKIDLKTSKKIAIGQIRVVLFGEEFAKKGLKEALHTLKMNAEISNGIYLGVVEGEAKSLLENKYQNISDIGQHIFQLIDHNKNQRQVISSTLHEINRDNLSNFANFMLPILKKEGEFIQISGIAFFKDGKMVGNLPMKDTFYMMMIQDNFKSGTLELLLPGTAFNSGGKSAPEEIPIAIDSIKSKRKNKVVDKNVPEFDLSIDLEFRLLEVDSQINIGSPKSIKKLEQEINKKMESEISRIIKYTQEINSDVLRFGEEYHAQVRNTKNEKTKWDELYPKMKVNVTVNSKMIRNGVFE